MEPVARSAATDSPEPVAVIGDRGDPDYTLRVLRQRLRQGGIRQATLTSRETINGLHRHGWILEMATGEACFLVEEAFASGYGGQGAEALAQAVRGLARQRVRLGWQAGFPDWAVLAGGTAALRQWAAGASPLWVRRHERCEAYSVTFDPGANLLTIADPPSIRRRLTGDPRQLALFDES